jgi:simple sugar transport system permease protein
MMLAGAYTGFLAAYATHSFALGFVGGAAGGLLAASVVIVFCVLLGAGQIPVGIGVTLGAQGVTALLHHVQFARSYPRLAPAETWPIPGLARLPVIGDLFDRPPAVYAAIALVFILGALYRATNLGLNLRAAGDKPAALDAAGVGVAATRGVAVAVAGALAGAGGAFLATIEAGVFVPFMTNGSGFIGIVLAMLARGKPVLVLFGALLFGACLSLATALQVAGIDVPVDVINMLPFAAVMGVLVVMGRRARLPAALGTPFVRGAR